MQFKNGLALFSRTNSPGHWNIASWHSPHSMTWRWTLTFSLFHGDDARVRPLWWSLSLNSGPRWGFRIPFVGMVSCQSQQPMWYRDLYRRLQDNLERERYQPRKPIPPPPQWFIEAMGHVGHEVKPGT